MKERTFMASEYRFGFNGQEQDGELMDGAVSFKYRVHDPRIGRFLSVDPLAPEYPWNSSYAFAENRVIDGIDLEGLEKYIITFRTFIPTPEIENPNPFGTSDNFKGDDRKYYSVDATDYRTEQKVSIDFEKGKVRVLNNKASSTIGLNSEGEELERSEE
jgi:RHS repeat-associated protein